MTEEKKTVLYIDGENFRYKAAGVLIDAGLISKKHELIDFSFTKLAETALNEFVISKKQFYSAKIHLCKDDKNIKQKSCELIEAQRILKRRLTNDGTDFIIAGNVRLQNIISSSKGRRKYIFKEKGVDVQLAIDALSDVCDGIVDIVLLLSSDSDMQPLVREVKKRGAKIVYIGFEDNPNLGLSNNCNQTILLRKKEIIEAWQQIGNQDKALSNYTEA